MPNLPGSDAQSDLTMFDHVLYDHTMQVDQWKIYPYDHESLTSTSRFFLIMKYRRHIEPEAFYLCRCETVPWTVIKQWYESGKYVPYPGKIRRMEWLPVAVSSLPPTSLCDRTSVHDLVEMFCKRPCAETELFELLLDVKSRVHPWIRLNRVIRDIPSQCDFFCASHTS